MQPITWMKIGGVLIAVGVLISIFMTLQSSQNLAFYTTNIGFITLGIFIATGVWIVRHSPVPLHWHALHYILGLTLCGLLMGIYPLVLWVREGSVCNSLSSDQLAAARACYTSAKSQAPRVTNIAQFTNVIATYTLGCYQSQEIIGAVNDICYNVMWDPNTAVAVYAFQFIAWFLMEIGMLIVACSIFMHCRQHSAVYVADYRLQALLIATTRETLRLWSINKADDKAFWAAKSHEFDHHVKNQPVAGEGRRPFREV